MTTMSFITNSVVIFNLSTQGELLIRHTSCDGKCQLIALLVIFFPKSFVSTLTFSTNRLKKDNKKLEKDRKFRHEIQMFSKQRDIVNLQVIRKFKFS